MKICLFTYIIDKGNTNKVWKMRCHRYFKYFILNVHHCNDFQDVPIYSCPAGCFQNIMSLSMVTPHRTNVGLFVMHQVYL